MTVLVFSLNVSKGIVIKVQQDPHNRVNFIDGKGKPYEYFTKAFVMSPNEYIKHDDVVKYPHRIGSDGAEHWLLKKPGVYIFDVNLKFKSSARGQYKEIFNMTIDNGNKRSFREDSGKESVTETWVFNINKPGTGMKITFYAYKIYLPKRGT